MCCGEEGCIEAEARADVAPKVCPTCGRCPTCGSTPTPYVAPYVYPTPYTYPYYPGPHYQPTYIWSGTTEASY